MMFFPNCEVELWDYGEDDALPNIYGEVEQYYVLVDIVECDWQNMSNQDSLKEFGKILSDTYKLYFDEDTVINDRMIIRKVGERWTYEIKGTPMSNNHFDITKHKKIIVQKNRKPIKLESYDGEY